jgi:DNA-binding SARP family transcriptional activator
MSSGSGGAVETPEPVFRLLGKLRVPGEPRLEAHPAALVAFFLLHPNTTFHHDRLRAIAPSLDQQLSKARVALQRAGYPLHPERRSAHHSLIIDPDVIDVTLFRALARGARAAQRAGDEKQALELAEEALALWSEGRALPELRGVAGFRSEADNLDRERLQVEVTRLASLLALGRHDDVIPELAASVELRLTEAKLVNYLMLAFFRSHDPAAALDVFKRHRRALREEQGLDPHPDLIDLEQGILRNDRSLLLPGHQPQPQTRGEIVEVAPASGGEQHAAWEIPYDESAVDETGRLIHRLDERLRRPEPVKTAPTADDVSAVLQQLQQWAESESVLALFDAWEWEEPLPRPTGTTYIERFLELESATEAWNYRRYAFERWQQLLANLPKPFQDQVIEAAEELGMREWAIPLQDHYQIGVALGGARRAPLCRTKWLELLSHRCQFDAFGYATSLRPIDERAERAYTTYAPRAETEFDLMHHAARLAPGLGHIHRWRDEPDFESDYPTRWWASSLIRYYERAPAEAPMFGVAAASQKPLEHRPRTPETLRTLYGVAVGNQSCSLEPGSRILLVTSAIYVPYQQIEALRVLGLPSALVIETVAHPREWTAEAQAAPLQNYQLVGNYLQEIRSAIEACRRLADDFPRESKQPVSDMATGAASRLP